MNQTLFWKTILCFDMSREEVIEKRNLKNENLEKEFKINKCPIDFGNYPFQFKHLFQYNNLNNQKQIPVKSAEREERFSFHTNKLRLLEVRNSVLIQQKAAKGILELGCILTNDTKEIKHLIDAQEFSALLLKKKNKTLEIIASIVIQMYTQESFLYRKINRAFRENDKTRACISYFVKLMNYSLQHFSEKKIIYPIKVYYIEDAIQQQINRRNTNCRFREGIPKQLMAILHGLATHQHQKIELLQIKKDGILYLLYQQKPCMLFVTLVQLKQRSYQIFLMRKKYQVSHAVILEQPIFNTKKIR
ncbi:unnamed protein product [Paramecium sonneborni]|uniref:Uncharacterized protein n=1 Tax=Paramecium sonneborni TaxID=65129 RepID=A0A8S1RQI7_9CILI|nr:unnamed protein product [Paramecium sonneborni]